MFGTTKQQKILDILSEHARPMYGLEIVKASEAAEASGSALKRGTVYVHLGRLEEAGQITSDVEQSPTYPDMPRHLYRITETGRRVRAKRNERSARRGLMALLPSFG